MEEFYGRQVLLSKRQLQQEGKRGLCFERAIQEGRCMRCGSRRLVSLPCRSCGQFCLTCMDCLQMGPVRDCAYLVWADEPFRKKRPVSMSWQGRLSDQQKQGADRILAAIEAKEHLLVSAVTGAGKTEMLFPGLAYALSQGYRVCLAAPRVDVVLELAPRLQAAFEQEDIVVLHGRSPDPYHYSPFVICTTHQLLRFKEAFDLLIIDEVDSFPFHNNPLLEQRIGQVVKASHCLVYLTATPTRQQEQAIGRGELANFELPARYHGHLLPVPKLVWIGNWQRDIQGGRHQFPLLKLLEGMLKEGKRFLVFLPNIGLMKLLEDLLRRRLSSGICFACVHAQDPDRIEKVQAMRDRHYHFLMTTTILERGVTFENIDVLVVGAENPVYSRASLVQIAGRVGRKPNYPTGRVLFAHYGRTKEMLDAHSWIKKMNEEALKRGLIKGQSPEGPAP